MIEGMCGSYNQANSCACTSSSLYCDFFLCSFICFSWTLLHWTLSESLSYRSAPLFTTTMFLLSPCSSIQKSLSSLTDSTAPFVFQSTQALGLPVPVATPGAGLLLSDYVPFDFCYHTKENVSPSTTFLSKTRLC